MFYKCQHEDIWINLNYVEMLYIQDVGDSFQVRAKNIDDSRYSILESFENRDEAAKCIEYILGHIEDD